MADTLLLQLVSPERLLSEEPVTEVQIPALDGYIGVLPGHAPLLSELKPGGVLTYHTGNVERVLAIYGGFVEVLPDRVRVLADGAEFREEINLQQAQQELSEATKAMGSGGNGGHGGEDVDLGIALAAAMRAQAKVDAATKK
ncbi:MAG: ATP synthase F1 subunit epsilon [Bryobacteraceae bacterium]|jgi:F-type H+-transporting ATPase subunit epsilon